MKRMKKIFAVILSLAMVLGMSMTASAVITTGAGIKVKGLSTQGKQEVKAYKICTLDANNNDWVVSDWAKSTLTEDELTDLSKLEDSDILAKLKGSTSGLTADATGNNQDGTNFNSEVTLTPKDEKSPIEAGAYLVLVNDTTGKTTYNPMVAITYEYNNQGIMTGKQAEVVAKAETYDIAKEQKDPDGVVAVGDLIEYEIKTTVPYVKTTTTTSDDGEGNTVTTTTTTPTKFNVTDELTGATYYLSGDAVKGKNPVNEVKIGGNVAEGISAIPADANNGTTFTLNLTSLLKADNQYAGQEVVIKYTAKVTAVDTITNKAKSDQVLITNPDGTKVEKEVTTEAKTGSMNIIKKSAQSEGDKPLAGAVFALYRMNDSDQKEYAYITDNYITGEWSTTLAAKGTGMSVTTGVDGKASVKGLDVGTYYFEEVVAPAGYSLNTTDRPSATITKDKLNADEQTLRDTKLSTLPSTGGIGTTIFTIGGCAIMIIAAALFFASRRKSAK